MKNPPIHIVVAEPYAPEAIERLREFADLTVLDGCDDDVLRKAAVDCDALLVRTYAKVTRSVLEAGTRLKVVGRGGVGLDNIDVDAARSLGIQVVHTPAAATDAVADLTIGLMIALVRGVLTHDKAVRAGRFFESREAAPSVELSELTIGIIGLGRIGRAVARRCRIGLGMAVLYNDIADPGRRDFDASAVSKAVLYERADVISLHVPLTPATTKLIDADALARFKSGAFLINTARGAVVDCEAAAAALESGHLGGAAFDVFDPEPLPPGHSLLSAPGTIFTPHIGARTHGALRRMNDVVADVRLVLDGRRPTHPAW